MTATILFSAPMVRAIDNGTKTQTRRVMKPQPEHVGLRGGKTKRDCWTYRGGFLRGDAELIETCPNEEWPSPYGAIGDRLVLLSSWATDARYDAWKPTDIATQMAPGAPVEHGRPLIWTRWDGGDKPAWCGKLRPGRFMPTAMRHLLPRAEITDLRVERVQDISGDDIRAEGVTGNAVAALRGVGESGAELEEGYSPIDLWRLGWTAINGAESWALNPWVWAISFRRLP